MVNGGLSSLFLASVRKSTMSVGTFPCGSFHPRASAPDIAVATTALTSGK